MGHIVVKMLFSVKVFKTSTDFALHANVNPAKEFSRSVAFAVVTEKDGDLEKCKQKY